VWPCCTIILRPREKEGINQLDERNAMFLVLGNFIDNLLSLGTE
jgi:hypothetical protein